MPNILPMPGRLEPKAMKSALRTNVKVHFYPLYNNDPAFVALLASVDNKSSVTKNRYFDRKEAVDMIMDAAKQIQDTVVTGAKAGEVYKALVSIMGDHPALQLKLRRQEYRRLTQQSIGQQPAQQAAE